MKQTDTLGAPIPITPKYVDELIKKAQTVEELEQIRAKYKERNFMGFGLSINVQEWKIRFRNLERRVEALEKHG